METSQMLKTQITKQDFTTSICAALIGKRCWYVHAGVFPPVFKLAIGRKIKRAIPVKNRALPLSYRKNEGEANLLVWCAWRLQKKGRMISSSDDDERHSIRSIESVVGATILEVKVLQPAWDLNIEFGSGIILQLFSDQVRGTINNWEIFEKERIIIAGPGSKFGVKCRELPTTQVANVEVGPQAKNAAELKFQKKETGKGKEKRG